MATKRRWTTLTQRHNPLNDMFIDLLIDAREKFDSIKLKDVRIKSDNPISADLLLYISIYIYYLSKTKKNSLDTKIIKQTTNEDYFVDDIDFTDYEFN